MRISDWSSDVCSSDLLALLYWFSVLDRFIIGLMVDPIKRDLGLTDLQFGILHGSAFAITFSVVGLLAGALADRYNRRWVIYAGVTIWSIATAACGFAYSFWQIGRASCRERGCQYV